MPERAAPRLMTKADLRNYMRGLPWQDIKTRMQTGRLPGPVWGLDPTHPAARWDKRAIDRALDAASALPATIEQDTDLLDRALGTR